MLNLRTITNRTTYCRSEENNLIREEILQQIKGKIQLELQSNLLTRDSIVNEKKEKIYC